MVITPTPYFATMHIIGGGIIGLCCAWYLRQAGYEVTVVDRGDLQDGCSFGNAGIIVPSHFVPLASPGAVAKGMRWMLNARSPFFIRPRFDPDLWRWMWRFYRSSNPAHVDAAAPVLCDFQLLSKSLYRTFAALPDFGFDFEERGSLMLYRTAKGKAEELEGAERAEQLGLEVKALTVSEVEALCPGLRSDILGGVHYTDDAHLYPGNFVTQLHRALQSAGVRFLTDHEVTGFITSGTKVTHLKFQKAPVEPVREVILAGGAWTDRIARQLGLKLLMQDGKGYSVTLPSFGPRPTLPVILSEARVAVTPMGNDLRIGGTLEVSNFDRRVSHKRVEAILRAMTQYYPDFPTLSQKDLNIWHGFRPVSADGLPYIGRPRSYNNVILASGHAMLGMSLGPATGLCISEIAQGIPTSVPMELFHADRHG